MGSTPPEHQETVRSCPCSAAETPHTAAWRLARLVTTLRARERPLAVDVESYLRHVADGREWVGGDVSGVPWENLGLVTFVDGRPALTDLGRLYLSARTDIRVVTPVRVLDVDPRTRTARVEVPGWRAGETVTVLLDQLMGDLDTAAEELPRWVAAEANCAAPDADALLLTRFRPHTSGSTVAPGTEQDDGTAVTRVEMLAHEWRIAPRLQDPPPLPVPVPFLLDESDGDVL
ncbi:hypothetical protein [Embleya sp. AB8]|uniref:hypothetical protein n=1 Tax=Embleya sp. AB8 TaxID=3156304 RepID=UPI003C756A9D